MATELMARNLFLVRSNTGCGGWSIHTRKAVAEADANGDVPEVLLSGPASWIEETEDTYGRWDRPNDADYAEALAVAEMAALQPAYDAFMATLDADAELKRSMGVLPAREMTAIERQYYAVRDRCMCGPNTTT